MQVKFIPYAGDLRGLPTNENHLNFKWLEADCNVFFSVTRVGNYASIHVASDKDGRGKLVQAIEDFIAFVYWIFDWCDGILGRIIMPSVAQLVERECGFKKIYDDGNKMLYLRRR